MAVKAGVVLSHTEMQETVPRPDPTARTLLSLHREIEGLRQLIEARLEGIEKVADKIPFLIEQAISQLQKLHQEKFDSIAIQFRERDTRAEQTSKDSKVAVDAALQAAKEAVGEQNKSSALAISKSEVATMKQIDQIGTLINTQGKSLDDKVVDIKDRVTAIESHEKGGNDLWAYLVGAVGLVIGFAGVGLALVRAVSP